MSAEPDVPAPTPEFVALQEAVLGRYSLDRELGRGGMGVVFLARDVALDRPVAIKLLPPSLAASPAARERFLGEARAAARLSHPHIVPVHAVEEHGALALFVMAYVDGETLGERVRRAGPLPPAAAMRVVQEVAWALAHAHANGVVHRDVKPDNILLEREGGRALVTDFGIAHLAGGAARAHTPTAGVAIGTPQYMSPEQAAGEPADARSDLYALGVTAFFAATGRLPFEGRSAAALLAQHVGTPAPPLLTVRPSLPPRFAAAVDACLAKDPADRPATAERLAVSLGEARVALPETPAPVRAFLRDAHQAGSEMGNALTAAAVSASLFVLPSVVGSSVSGILNGIVVAIAYAGATALAAAVAATRAAQLVASARALLRRGYDHRAVSPALAVEQREAEAEREAEALAGAPPPRPAAPTWGVALGGAAATAGAVWLVQMPVPDLVQTVAVGASIVIPTATARVLWRRSERGRRVWPRLLAGRLGRLAFRLAGVGLPAGPAARPAAGEPTVVALGRAADALFAALPAAQRGRLGDVPALVARLRADAERLRALADTGGGAGEPGGRAAERLRVTVAALEAVRLDLLKLHAGAGSLDELTRDVEAARELGRRVDAELLARDAARGDVRGAPGERGRASTPA